MNRELNGNADIRFAGNNHHLLNVGATLMHGFLAPVSSYCTKLVQWQELSHSRQRLLGQ